MYVSHMQLHVCTDSLIQLNKTICINMHSCKDVDGILRNVVVLGDMKVKLVHTACILHYVCSFTSYVLHRLIDLDIIQKGLNLTELVRRKQLQGTVK